MCERMWNGHEWWPYSVPSIDTMSQTTWLFSFLCFVSYTKNTRIYIMDDAPFGMDVDHQRRFWRRTMHGTFICGPLSHDLFIFLDIYIYILICQNWIYIPIDRYKIYLYIDGAMILWWYIRLPTTKTTIVEMKITLEYHVRYKWILWLNGQEYYEEQYACARGAFLNMTKQDHIMLLLLISIATILSLSLSIYIYIYIYKCTFSRVAMHAIHSFYFSIIIGRQSPVIEAVSVLTYLWFYLHRWYIVMYILRVGRRKYFWCIWSDIYIYIYA